MLTAARRGHRLSWLLQLSGDTHVGTFWCRVARRPDVMRWRMPRAVCRCLPCQLERRGLL